MSMIEVIPCGHSLDGIWRWKSVGPDGVFCEPCQRVYPVGVEVEAEPEGALAFLLKLQSEADKYGFHRDLKAWVDDNSGVARVLRAMYEGVTEFAEEV